MVGPNAGISRNLDLCAQGHVVRTVQRPKVDLGGLSYFQWPMVAKKTRLKNVLKLESVFSSHFSTLWKNVVKSGFPAIGRHIIWGDLQKHLSGLSWLVLHAPAKSSEQSWWVDPKSKEPPGN